MKKIILFASMVFIYCSCRFIPGDDSKHEGYLKEGPAYKLVLNPSPGSKYRYSISNKTEMNMEVNDRKVDNINNSDVDIIYSIDRDSAGDFKLAMEYDKIHLFTKTGDNESEMDASNAKYSTNPVEKLLGVLKASRINAVLNKNGSLKSLSGYKELSDKMFSELNFIDTATRTIARQQWTRTIEGSMIRQNFDQFFKIFPDSAVHLHEKWKITTTQQGEFPVKVTTTYFVKAITENEVFIESYGDIMSENSENNSSVVTVSSDLNGEQNGEYVMELNTGMVLSAKISSTINGTVQMRGIKIPLKIKSKITLKGTVIK